MKRLAPTPLLLCFISLNIGCRVDSKSPDHGIVGNHFDTADELNVQEVFPLENPDCQSVKGLDHVGRFQVDIHAQSESEEKYIPDLTSREKLQASGIASVIYGQRIQVEATGQFTSSSGKVSVTENKTRVLDQGKALKICETDFSESSFERQALTTVAHVKGAIEFFNQHRQALKPVEINLLPEKKVHLTVPGSAKKYYVYFDGNNASYSFNNGNPVITLLRRIRKPDKYFDAKLWTSQFVISHEYGHHIFALEALSELTSSSISEILRLSHIHRENMHHKLDVQYSGSLFKTGEDDLYGFNLKSSATESALDEMLISISALNEAFADLFSYFANEERSGLVDGISSLEVSRDLKSSYFADGSSKLLTSRHVQDLVTQQKSSMFRDNHIVGAVFAYTFATMLEKHSRKMDVLLRWLDLMDLRFKALKKNYDSKEHLVGGEYSLRAGLADFLLALTENQDGQLTSDQCDIVKTRFPFLDLYSVGSMRIKSSSLLEQVFSCSSR